MLAFILSSVILIDMKHPVTTATVYDADDNALEVSATFVPGFGWDDLELASPEGGTFDPRTWPEGVSEALAIEALDIALEQDIRDAADAYVYGD